MAGIGIQLNKIFNKNTLITSFYGIGFSIVYTIMPMLVVIFTLLAMYKVLGFQTISYTERQLFSSSILYIFIFSLLVFSLFTTVISKYQADKIFLEHYEDIRPSIYVGTVLILTCASCIAIPFYCYAILIGNISPYYVFTSYMAFLGMTLTFSSMLHNLTLKQYKQLSIYFFIGMTIAFLLSVLFRFVLDISLTYSMLLSLSIGFFIIAALGISNVLRFFPDNSHRYKEVFAYFRKYWRQMLSNFFYTLGLFIHNFIFWTKPWNLVVYSTYVSNETYDMASFLAMFTNVTATVLFITRLEMQFKDKYKNYNEAVLGGKLKTIKNYEGRMFDGLASQIFTLASLQFIISVILFFIAILLFPRMGFSGLIMDIYPLLIIAYYISILFYSELIFLYYFEDSKGAVMSGMLFVVITFLATLWTSNWNPIWYGLGFVIGALSAFTFAFFRLRWISNNYHTLVFCRDDILKNVYQEIPSALVYNRNQL
ncbi:MAG: exopolysaccharide Pel transporter PelG [Peptostreptococcales bacterium]